MADGDANETSFAAELTGPRFIEFQMRLNGLQRRPVQARPARRSRKPGTRSRTSGRKRRSQLLSRHSARRLRDCRAYQRTPAALIELAPHRERLTTYRRPLRNSLRRWDHRNANWRQRRPFGSMPSSLSARTKRPMRLAFFCATMTTHGDRNNFVCFKVLLRAPQTDLPMARYPRRRGHVEPKSRVCGGSGHPWACCRHGSNQLKQSHAGARDGCAPERGGQDRVAGVLLLALPPLRHRLTRHRIPAIQHRHL